MTRRKQQGALRVQGQRFSLVHLRVLSGKKLYQAS